MQDLNFYFKWLSYLFFLISGLIFFLKFLNRLPFSYLEQSILKKWMFEKLGDVNDKSTAQYQFGLWSLILALQMFYGLYLVNQLEPQKAGLWVSLSAFSMISSILLEAFTVQNNKKQILIQLIPLFLGFLFLSYHIYNRLHPA